MSLPEAWGVFVLGALGYLAMAAVRAVLHGLIDLWAARHARQEREAWSRRYGKGPHGD